MIPKKPAPHLMRGGNRFSEKRSCPNKKLERDDDSKKSHPALRLKIDRKRRQHARVHVVAADEDGQFYQGAIVKMAPHLREYGIRDGNLSCHGIGIGQRGALARRKERRAAPIRQGILRV